MKPAGRQPVDMSDESTPSDEPPHAAIAEATEPKRWSTTTKVLSGVVAVVGAATGIFTIVQSVTRDASSFDTLSISATAVNAGETEFALPLAQLGRDDFPAGVHACSPEQLEWLNSHALQLDRRLRVDMRNFASEGAMLALVDFRAEPEAGMGTSSTHILVSCPVESTVSVARAALLRVDAQGDTARFRPLPNSQSASSLPDVPVSWNLAPGESGVVDIKLASQQPLTGSLLVTVLSGREEADVPISGAAFDLPGLWKHGDVYLSVGETGLECVTETRGGPETCAESDVAALLEARDVLVSRG